MKILGYIPARSGSSLKDKNIRKFCGKPLMAYQIEAAKRCENIFDVWVDSDSDKYLDVARYFGAKVYKRQHELAADSVSIKDTVIGFIESYRDVPFDALLLLYCVYPLRTFKELYRIIEFYKLYNGNRPTIGIKRPSTHPYLIYRKTPGGFIEPFANPDENKYYQRQLYPTVYELTHYACIVPIKMIKEGWLTAQLTSVHSQPYEVPVEDLPRTLDIDTEVDFRLAEILWHQGCFDWAVYGASPIDNKIEDKQDGQER